MAKRWKLPLLCASIANSTAWAAADIIVSHPSQLGGKERMVFYNLTDSIIFTICIPLSLFLLIHAITIYRHPQPRRFIKPRLLFISALVCAIIAFTAYLAPGFFSCLIQPPGFLFSEGKSSRMACLYYVSP